MPTCENCQSNEASVRLDAIINGQRESHVFCQRCAEEVMRGAIGGGIPAGSGLLGSIFGRANGPGSAGPGTATAERQGPQSKTPVLDHFGRDLTQDAADGKLDPAAGREREIRRTVTVLGRRQKNNPVLLGEPGVGKTAIVEGIARRIAEGSAPPFLRGKRLIALHLGGMVAGAMFRGQFEERVRPSSMKPRPTPPSSSSSTSCTPSSARAPPRAPWAPPICSSPPWRAGSCA